MKKAKRNKTNNKSNNNYINDQYVVATINKYNIDKKDITKIIFDKEYGIFTISLNNGYIEIDPTISRNINKCSLYVKY